MSARTEVRVMRGVWQVVLAGAALAGGSACAAAQSAQVAALEQKVFASKDATIWFKTAMFFILGLMCERTGSHLVKQFVRKFCEN